MNPGDTVELKSGGPVMTLGRPLENDKGLIECFWFDGNEIRTAVIPPAALKPAKPKLEKQLA